MFEFDAFDQKLKLRGNYGEKICIFRHKEKKGSDDGERWKVKFIKKKQMIFPSIHHQRQSET